MIVVDHGGPSPLTAQLRNEIAAQVATLLGSEVPSISAASMESPAGDEFAFNRPLLSEALQVATGTVIIAPLFLSPGRHAGPAGDLAQIARAAESATSALGQRLHCQFTALVGTHPLAVAALATSLEPFIFRKLASVPT